MDVVRFLISAVSAMVASTGAAAGLAKCPVDAVPMQAVSPGYGSSSVSVANIPSSAHRFPAFVIAVMEHVAGQLSKERACIDSAESKNRSLFQFVAWPLLGLDGRYPGPVLKSDAPGPGSCRISSPWVDIVFERKPVPSIRAVVRWNERQMLADQAVLVGIKNVPTGVAIPLTGGEFWSSVNAYTGVELLYRPAEKPLEDIIPPDFLWLLRHSFQTTVVPFDRSVLLGMKTTLEKGSDSYTHIITALIDRCLSSKGMDLHYNSILDVTDLIQVEKYKINSLTR
jgi:hypothetical protein